MGLPISRALMTAPQPHATILQTSHLLGIDAISPAEITALLDLAETYVSQNRAANKKSAVLSGRTLINLFFEASTRTQSSFELAGKRLGADVLNMSVKTSSVSKGETLIDTATTLNAMRPDILVVRHQRFGGGGVAVAQAGLLCGERGRRKPRTSHTGPPRCADHQAATWRV